MTLHEEAVALLTAWSAKTPEQDGLRRDYLAHLAAHPDGVWRSGPPAHLTASCFVLDRTLTSTLLSHHRKGGFWVQFGGHCEPGDTDLAATALREGREESGLADLELVTDQPVDLDRHDLSSAFGRCRTHLDVAFAAVVETGAVPTVSDESVDVAWFDLDALPADLASDLPRRLHGVVRTLAGPV